MITATSSSNGKSQALHLYRFILRRYLGAAILYFLLQLLFFPLQYVLTAADTLQMIAREGARAEITSFIGNGGIYNAVSQPVMLGMMIIVPILFPLLQLSYLHQKKSVDLYHALPIRRERLLLVHFAASATMVFLPLLINFLLVLIAGLSFQLPCFSLPGLFYELLLMSASVLGILSISCLTSVLAGTVFDNLLYAGGTLFGLPLTLYAAYTQMELLLYGFTDAYGLRRRFALLSPATFPLYSYFHRSLLRSPSQALSRSSQLPLFITALIWLLLSAVLLLLSAWLYRRRKSELAGQSGAHNGLSFFLKLLGALLGGICLSMLLCSVSNLQQLFISIPAALAGGAITCCLIESILARGFKTLKKSVVFIAVGALLPAFFILAVGTGGLGFESRVPDFADIESVVLTDSRDRYGFARYDLEEMRAAFADTSAAALKQRSLFYQNELRLKQPESLEQILLLHKTILQEQKKGSGDERSQLHLCYRLKNGRTLTRYYSALPKAAALLSDQISALAEVKRQTHPLFSYGPAGIREITLMNRLMAGITPVSLSESDTGRLIEALRADMLEEPYEEMVNPDIIGYIVLTPQYDQRYWSAENLRRADFTVPAGETGFSDCYVALTPRYTRTLSLLGQFGYGSFTEIDFSCFEAAYVRLDGFYSDGIGLTGPAGFQQAAYQKENYDALFYLSSCDTRLTNPADIKTLAGLIRYNPSQSAVTLPYTDGEYERFGQWNSQVTLHFMLAGRNDENLITDFYIRPCDVPESILLQLRERFSYVWGEELFDWILEKFRDPASLQTGPAVIQTETAAAQNYIQARF